MYNLKAVARQTGLSPETLRAWERRYGAVNPGRGPGGRRHYTDAELKKLLLLSTLVARGFRIGEVAGLDDRALAKRLEESRGSVPGSRGVSELTDALDRFDLGEVRRRLARVRFQLSPREFALELVPALMHRVGVLIDEGRFSVAQEHALSHLVQSELRLIYESLESMDGSLTPGRRVLFATREGDFHEIGLVLAAILCRTSGLQCQYLGPNLPSESLIEAARELRPMAVVLALSYLPPENERVVAADYLKELDRGLSRSVELWVGGSATPRIARARSGRTFWVFESLRDLESKLGRVFPGESASGA